MTTTTVAGFSPKPQIIARLPDISLQRLQSVIDSKGSIPERHNAFTDYCLGMLFCCTGHRAVKDPFSALRHFDLDHGLLLISDKVSDETRAWRLVALPELAVEQVQIYQKYLRVLAARLQASDRSSSLPAKILSLCRGGTGMPLFFYLRENSEGLDAVTPATLAKRWADFWQLPINFQRHITADTLLQLTQRADWVSIQLGHADGVDHSFGRVSSQSALEVLSKIRPYLNDGLKQIGWTVVRPPLSGAMARDGSHALKPAPASALFGPERREADRKVRRKRSAKFVLSLWNERFPDGGAVDSESVQQLAQQIILQAPIQGYSINWCLQLLYQYIRSRPGGAAVIRQLARYRRIEVQPSPFHSGSLADYKKTRDVRAGFAAYLDRQGRASVTPGLHTRVAEIVFSAAVFGGMASTARLNILGSSLLTHTYSLDKDALFVDLPLGKANATFRWFPDPVSQSLIFGLFRMTASHEELSAAQLKKSLKSLVGQVAGPGVRAPVDWLVNVSEAALKIEMPGYIAACLRGDVPAVALPLRQLVRVATGRRLKTVDQEPSPRGSDEAFWSPNIRPDSPRRHTAGEGREFLNQLRRIVSGARNTKPHGRLLPRTRSKRELTKQLKILCAGESWSPMQMMLAAWAVYLCEHGTRYDRNLAYSTVEKYIIFVASRLLPVAADQNADVHDEVVLEDLYLRAIEREVPARRFELASRLREMHAFFTDAYLLEDLDWSAVMGAAGGREKAAYADANYVGSAEYRLALQSLIKEDSLSERRRWQYAGLLLLGYRFGLRFGEAFRLRYTDVQRDGDQMFVWVHHSAHGEAKSDAGVRVVPLIERLEALEVEVLDHLLSAGEADFAEHAGAVLMAATAGSVELLDRADAARVLNGLLRRVTGDNDQRFHHLRHGWVTRAVAAQAELQAMGFDEQLTEAAHEDFFGNDAGFPLRSVAVGAGHTSELTTLASYTHNLDQLAHAYYRAPTHSDYVTSYAEQIALATVRTRRRADRSATGRLPSAIPRPVETTEPLRLVSVSDLIGRAKSQSPAGQFSLVEVDLLLRRYTDNEQAGEDLARNLGWDVITAQRVLSRALEVELRMGYDGYGMALRSSDLVAESVKRAGYRQFRRETDRVKGELSKIESKFAGLMPDEQTRVLRGVAVWVEAADAGRSNACTIGLTEQLAAVVDLARFLGIHIEAYLSTEADTQGMRALLESYGVPYKVAGGGRVTGLRLKISSTEWPARTLQRLLLVIASGPAFLSG